MTRASRVNNLQLEGRQFLFSRGLPHLPNKCDEERENQGVVFLLYDVQVGWDCYC